MTTYTRENTEIAVDIDGLGRQHRAEAGGMTIALEQWRAGLDTAEMFADLPDGACQEPHFGYVVSGRATVRYTDGRTETLTPGQAYYLHPGHNVHLDEDTEFVEFTPADQTPGINTLELSSTAEGAPVVRTSS
jgi:hypothetical protein